MFELALCSYMQLAIAFTSSDSQTMKITPKEWTFVSAFFAILLSSSVKGKKN